MHQKHPKIPRPAQGYYARTEFAFVGSTCERMEALMREWAAELGDTSRVVIVTGEHAEPEVPTSLRFGRKRFTTLADDWNDYDDRVLGRAYDVALVNGNHYPAARQIVFVDEKKAGTLERRAEQLTDIFAVIHVSGEESMPRWLRERCLEQHRPPVMTSISLTGPVLSALRQETQDAIPSLQALILAGGASSRMGTPKDRIVYRNGQTELERLNQLCASCGVPAFVSVSGVTSEESFPAPTIADRFLGLGPAGAIASAFLAQPDVAWLVLACDLPMLDRDTVLRLIEARDPVRTATAVRGPGREWPEPLIAIYEPRAYPRLLQFLGLGYSCPRKLLINSPVKLLDLEDMTPLTNANTPEERDRVRKMLD